jgi:hypothetical protein
MARRGIFNANHYSWRKGRAVSVSDDEKSFFKVLKWAGIVALVTVPLVVYLNKRKADAAVPSSSNDDSDIFDAEL